MGRSTVAEKTADRTLAPGLYVVETPIGNLGEVSPRARSVLIAADCIACEDRRVTGKLLGHLAVARPLLVCHEYNERKTAETIADRIGAGGTVALVSDAGTPTLSDPGFRVVRECRRRGLPVFPIPGPNAAIAALSASGLPTDAFLYLGFPPHRTAARRRLLLLHRDFPHTIVLYEAPHRVSKLLDEIVEIHGAERTIAVARELTKLYETWHVGAAGTVRDAHSMPRGEYVVLIAPAGFVL